MKIRQFFTTQTWWGKLIGAFLGYLIAGPAGALFGILIGNFFDRGLHEHFSRPFWLYHSATHHTVQQVFFEATFSTMGYLAKADGRVSEAEIKMASSLMQEMHLRKQQKELAKQFFNQGKQADFNLERILIQLKKATHDNPELLKLFIDIQYRSAQIDSLSQKKLTAMNKILQCLGFAPLQEQYRFYEDFAFRANHHQQKSYSSQSNTHRQHSSYQARQSTKTSLDHAFAILGIDKNSTKQEVKKAYRRLISRNHPDKLIAQGLPESMIKIANDKTQTIRKAYEQICESKGWS